MTSRPAGLDERVLEVAARVARAGGRALIVGGYVRDRFLGLDTKDLDIEVHGLEIARLEEVLRSFGEVIAVGRAFGVLRVKGIDIDFSLPRRDSKTGRGHRGFLVELDPGLGYTEAARRRDLTMNSMALDPLTGEVLDPHGGREDIARGILRATDPQHFAEDSLRGLRVAQFRARFELVPDAELRRLSAALDLSDLPAERVYEELKKLLLKGRRPSLGFEFLQETRLLRFFPELAAMVGVPQDPEWHPEGTVWEHTLLVLDEAARDRSGSEDEDLVLLLGALLHDVGKPSTTFEEGGRIRSPSHEDVGVPIARAFLERLRTPLAITEAVAALVRHHLAPAQFAQGNASPKAYRRLARKLEAAGTTVAMLHRVARADHFGRGTPDALARRFPAGDEFLRHASELAVELEPPADAVLGRHLIARGYAPGPWFGKVLERCREIQDETGWTAPDRILEKALEAVPPESP